MEVLDLSLLLKKYIKGQPLDNQQLKFVLDYVLAQIEVIRDKAEVMDYYVLNDVIDDLTKLIGDEENES